MEAQTPPEVTWQARLMRVARKAGREFMKGVGVHFLQNPLYFDNTGLAMGYVASLTPVGEQNGNPWDADKRAAVMPDSDLTPPGQSTGMPITPLETLDLHNKIHSATPEDFA